MDAGLIVAIAVPALLQAGALVYFAGSVSETLKDHERRITKTEDTTGTLGREVSYLKGKEGI
jgi:hypothetical protein